MTDKAINPEDILLIENILTLYKNKVMGSEVAQEEWTQLDHILKSLPQILSDRAIVERLKGIDMDILQDAVIYYLKECGKDFENSGHDESTALAYYLVNQTME